MSTPEEKEVSVAGQRDFPRVELPLEEKETFNHILTTMRNLVVRIRLIFPNQANSLTDHIEGATGIHQLHLGLFPFH